MKNNPLSALLPETMPNTTPIRSRPLQAWAVVAALSIWMGASPSHAAPVDCVPFARSAEAGKNAAQAEISIGSAATKEAVDGAKQCLTNIDRALNGLIPGVRFNMDLSGIVRGMAGRACQVVTSKIDGAGNLINGTASGVTNRVIQGVSSTVGLPSGTLTGSTTGATTTGVTSAPMGGGVTIGAPTTATPPIAPAQAPAAAPSLTCRLFGSC